MPNRCPWVPEDKPLYVEYHDDEWGVPSRDPHHLFEMLCLEGAQAGLSWWTILQRREGYRKVFHGFDPERVAVMSDGEIGRLVEDSRIIRHRGKIESVRRNARAWLALDGDPVEWLWSFVDGTPKVRRPRTLAEVAAVSPESTALSRALRKAGFGFVGPTTCHSFLQAVGMIDEHTVDCFRCR